MDNMPPLPPIGQEPPTPPMNDEPEMGDEGIEEPQEGGEHEGGVGSDVRKYSGELSQALNDYNQENPEDDEKLNKYAANMIAAQVANYLSDKDKRSVIKKIKGDMGDEEEPNNDTNSDDVPPVEESIVNEITNELTSKKRGTKRDERRITNKKVTRHNPFVSKR